MTGRYDRRMTAPPSRPHLVDVSPSYFQRMLSPEGLRISAAYHDEELQALEAVLAERACARTTFAAVGAGALRRLPVALAHAGRYVGIEPLGSLFVSESVRLLVDAHPLVSVIDAPIEKVCRDEVVSAPLDARRDDPPDPVCWAWLFNIVAYVTDPFEQLSRLCAPGDTIVLSTWASTAPAREVRGAYFDYLNEHEREVVIDHGDPSTHYPIEPLAERLADAFAEVRIVPGCYVDVLVACVKSHPDTPPSGARRTGGSRPGRRVPSAPGAAR